MSPVPRDWYAGTRRNISDLGRDADPQNVLTVTADFLEEHAGESFVVTDSLTDLLTARGQNLKVRDNVLTLK